MLVPLKLPPGVVNNGTPLATKGRWRDANFIRWVEGVMQPVGKWTRISPSPLPGRVCGMHPHRDDSRRRWLVVGSNEGVWTLRSGIWVDRTPTDFTAGYEITEAGVGYGAGDYSDETYGTPRSAETSISLEADTWSFDSWGTLVVGCSVGDGRALVWDPGSLTEPADDEFSAIAGAPIDNRSLLVTNERHLMLLAAGGDPRLVQWSAREDFTDWTPTALNLAGDLTLETAGTLQTGLKVANDILVLSETDAFRIRYVGQPFGYGQEKVGNNCGVIGPKAATATSDFAAWMGTNGFWVYRGQLEQIPCDVWDFVFRDLNTFQAGQISCGHNAEFNEIWWFFPKGDSQKNSHYVAWNYRDNWWTQGELPRTHWQERGIWESTLAAGVDGHIYEHEKKLNAPGARPRPRPFVESSPFEIGNGDWVAHATQLIPDQECRSLNALRYSFDTRFTPTCPANEFGPYFPDETGYTDVRFTGREVRWRVEAEKDIDWRMGVLRADIRQGGRR